MRRAPLLPPLAILAVTAPACAIQPSTPSMTAADLAEPSMRLDVAVPARSAALAAWMLPDSSPWAPYAKYTLLTALGETAARTDLPDIEALDDVWQARWAGKRVGSRGLPSDAIWIVDMRGAASVAFGEGMSRVAPDGLVSLVPTFNNWPADHEVVPAEEALAAMVASPPSSQANPSEGARPVFLLDAWRMANRSDEPDDEAYDNRYMLAPGDLPDAQTLREHGIRRVIYVVHSLDDTTLEEDDVHPAFLAWQEAGIAVAMIDLATIEQAADSHDWDEILDARAFVVEPRETIIDDPAFYARARGGFGGVHARPFRMPGGFGGHFGAHGASG